MENREQIMKGLECCQTEYDRNCHECPYERHKQRSISVITCESILREDLLSLIKELTEENERLVKALDTMSADHNRAISLTETYTVREMQNMFAVHFGTYTEKDEVKVLEVFKLLGKFAKEMLEDA